MASLLLSLGGAAAGGALFGPMGTMAGRLAGALAGNFIDHALFGGGGRNVEGPRLAALDVTASTEGAPIPRVYGRVRLSGQLIWATRFEEVVERRSDTSGGKSLGARSATTTYSYFANFAVGLCEGPIAHVGRVWADGKLLDLTGLTWRVHQGGETQAADPLIVAKDGAAHAPAYRGLAYVVFERLLLEKFGNRIPQLSFEIVRPVGRLETMVRAVTLIPGTTEFGYEPGGVMRLLGPGQSVSENRHVAHAASDLEASLDELQALCPNLQQVAVVTAWFGTDLRAGHCVVKPGVDDVTKTTHGALWSVAGLDRASAHAVSRIDERAAYGGTPSDASVINVIRELKARGLKVTLYPFLVMDVPADNALPDPWTGTAPQPPYPWRGRITCDPAPGMPGTVDATAAAADQVAALFGEASPGDFSIAGEQVTYAGPDEWTLRRQILHYAHLAEAAGGVDAFVIGSEMRGLTRVRSSSGVYPAVTQLTALAADVRGVLGGDTVITYAADWTEYGTHVPAPGELRFPLDPLWASSAIDVVGIDYYAPLSDWRDGADHLDRPLAESIYDPAYLTGNLAGGEGYDWYYADDAARAAQLRTPITDGEGGKPWVHRVKDFRNWWGEPHHERIGGVESGSPTAWVPQSKPIWLTEVGCPAVDRGSNQPSVFPDPKSIDGGLPHGSRGWRDDLIQRRHIEAVLGAFDPAFGATTDQNPVSLLYGGRMIAPSAIHLWTWDARPYPVFPAARDVWSDGANWETGHWLNGRLGGVPLCDLIPAILADAGITNVDASALRDSIDGYVIDRPLSPRGAIEPLALAYGFDASEDGALLRFRPRGGVVRAELTEDDLVLPERGASTRLVRAQETELPREIAIGFSDGGHDFQRSAVTSRRLVGGSARTGQADLAVVTNDAAAGRRADIWLQDLWAGRETVDFALPPSRLALTPGDLVGLTVNGRRHLIELRQAVETGDRAFKARTIDPGVFDAPLGLPRHVPPGLPVPVGPVSVTLLELPTLDAQEPQPLLRAAVFAHPWPGTVAIWRARGGGFERIALMLAPTIVGETLDPLAAGPTSRWDDAHAFRVRLYGGALASASDAAVLAGANVTAVRRSDGAWEVLQFAQAELVGDRTYTLSRLLRGQAGSEQAMGDPHPAGAPFVILDQHMATLARGVDALGRPMSLRVVAATRDHADPMAVALTATPGSTALRPLAPVHLRGVRTEAGIALSWIRRARRNAGTGVADVPLDEPFERYAVDILWGNDVMRTITISEPRALYAEADELTDFGTPQASLAVRVAQISATVGRGFAAHAILNHLA